MIALLSLLACSTAPTTGTFTTYNAGLAEGFVPGSVERRAEVATAIGAIDSDVICLQEVWTPDQVSAVAAASMATHPNQFFPEAQQTTDATPACPGDELTEMLECAETSCAGSCLDELPGCITSNCVFPFLSLEAECQGCFLANVGGSIQAIGDACQQQTTSYAYGGGFGTGILSRHPLRDIEEEVFESTTNRRSVLHAVAELPSGDVDVYCTHLTAVFSLIPYPRDEGDWDVEQTAQIDQLRTFVDTSSTGPVVLMGDFNAGPGGDGLDSEQIANYTALIEGYDNPYADLDGRCTFCEDNGLLALANRDTSELLDHVLFRGFEEPTYAATRILDGSLSHDTCGVAVDGAYSDHYGVRVELNPEAE